jgi:signal transduction histidine kinase
MLYAPALWAFYAVGFIQSRAVTKELRHSRNELSDALRAVRRAAREREGLVRFLCHELRSPLNCIALGFDEMTIDLASGSRSGSGLPDTETVTIVRSQIQNMHSCLDDLMLVVGTQAPSTAAVLSSRAALAEPGPESPSVSEANAARFDDDREISRSTTTRRHQALDASSLSHLLHAVARMTRATLRKPRRSSRPAQASGGSHGRTNHLAIHIAEHSAPSAPTVSVTVSPKPRARKVPGC